MKPVIRVENLSKQYQLGELGTGTVSHDLNRWWHRVRGKPDPYLKIGETNDRSQKGQSDLVWALKDINFEVQQGEVLGIIGKNGAGKSTLLKILSRITGPTTGRVQVKGRIASLLEVGTGFHPELTGRENIYLNGTILGMRKREVDRKLDEIVDFAGVARYLDTPVKRYSSGMMVRLGFAVAAHLEPEILIVDEVLAVGDAEFQKKALGKMKEVSSGEGRTVLFVSHNMEAVRTICNNALLMTNGYAEKIDSAERVVINYLQGSNFNEDVIFINQRLKNSDDWQIEKAFITKNGNPINSFLNGSELEVVIHIVGKKTINPISFELIVRDRNKYPVFFSPLGLMNKQEYVLNTGKHHIKLQFNPPYIAKGKYFLDIILAEAGKRIINQYENILFFEIESTYNSKSGWSFYQERGQGCVLLEGRSEVVSK